MPGVLKRLISKFKEIVSKEIVSKTPGAGSEPSAVPTAPPPFPVPPRTRETSNPYETAGILGIGKDELRKRALRIKPYQTAWIGRVDTIPPRSDERTALIDRGLVLRGLLTEAQLDEIHRVGDLWLEHHEVESLAASAATRAAAEFLEDAQKRKEEQKAEKKRLAAERLQARRAGIARRHAGDIIYLGRGVSSGLSDRRSRIEDLKTGELPVLSSPADLAAAMGLSVPRLRWLSFHTESAERPHYVYFKIPKRTGGSRLIAAPHENLKRAQDWILTNILEKVPPEKSAHGFVKKRSIVTNASPHKRQRLVVNIDLESFFPSITFPRVRGLFQSFGYSPAVSTILALLCTEAPRMRTEWEGKTQYVAASERCLPQGASTSPAISNLVCRKLDRRLSGLCRRRGWLFTRYADDLTFSASREREGQLPVFLASVRHILDEEGFRMNPRKFRIERRSSRQTVTGLVVNDKVSVPREGIRKIRAILHNAKSTGLAAQNRNGHPQFEAWLLGKIAFIGMIDHEKGKTLLREFNSLTNGRS